MCIKYLNNLKLKIQLILQCVQQGWYLAVDFQLSIVFLSILMVIWKFPKSLKFVLSATAVVCLIIPIVVVYIFKFDGIVITVPE